MSKIVLDHYPTANLPDDMRQGLEGVGEVRVTIETSNDTDPGIDAELDERPIPKPGLFSRFKHLRRDNYASDAEVDAYVRAMRDEWPDHCR